MTRRALAALSIVLFLVSIAQALVSTRAGRRVIVVLVKGQRFQADRPMNPRTQASGGVGLVPVRLSEDQGSFGGVPDLAFARDLAPVGALLVHRFGPNSISDAFAIEPGELVLVVPVEPARGGDGVGFVRTMHQGGGVRGLTSDTTHRSGIVSMKDVAPTTLEFLSLPIPASMEGSPIREEGTAPNNLLRRYLEHQRSAFPAQLVALMAVLVALGGGALVLWLGRRVPRLGVRFVGTGGLAAVAFPAVMLGASSLPNLTLVWVLPVMLAGAALVAFLAEARAGGDPAWPVAVVGGVGVAVLAVDALFRWHGMELSLLGSTALDGGRYYGMTNTYGGVLLGGAVLMAARMSMRLGVLLLVGAALLGGLPGLGANIGTSVAVFAAAGLWAASARRDRIGWREAAIALGVTVVGLAVILLAHRYLAATPTHGTRLVEGAEHSGIGSVVAAIWDRFLLNVRSTSLVPAAWLAVVALPICYVIAWRRLGPIGSRLAHDPQWRRACMVLAASAIVGFLVNDTFSVGAMALIGLVAALVYPTLRERWTSA